MSKKTAPKKAHNIITHKHQPNKWSRPKTGWVNNTSKPAKSNKVMLALIVLGLIILLIIVGKIFSVITGFQKPVYASSNIQRNYLWDKNSKINFVVKSDKISVVSFDPNEKNVTILTLPDNLYVNAPGGMGSWKVASLYELGQSNAEKNGGNLLKQAVSNFLGVPVEGYIVFKNDLAEDSVEELLENIRDGFWNGFSMTASLNTDFTPLELLSLNSGLRSIRFDKVIAYDMEDFNVLDSETLADGTNVYTSDPVRVDSIASKFFNTQVSEEKLPVAIFNSTDYPGLAQKAARIVSNLGGNVIISTNGSKTESKTVVYIKDVEKDLATPQVLGSVFASDCSDSLKCDIIVCNLSEETQNKQCQPDPQIIESRAQINVVLGEDFKVRF